ncbi:uncharacterized protein FOMMEDRAFT_170635 [Fomitiporia mediterranea MF3/22]|uniref:uncharacterized protein n=1 Tax=Fomitiporia mediterranea (strain MF3/22) TaxID=694068 RepID=UPI000440909C|nr:uncharacterized protein FOMMEDRAFT_170635 [Fomitiporia mediterranea MF3/22]EJC99348.1 hypothetical protein FOMMEDRAFT_170635 [Fomitiporia mediterranea MF3/22]
MPRETAFGQVAHMPSRTITVYTVSHVMFLEPLSETSKGGCLNLTMFFSSLVAENANRRDRLVFQTPAPIPAHSSEEHELKRFPSWMASKEDPFGTTITPTLRQPCSRSGSTSSTDSTNPVYEGGEEVNGVTSNESASNKKNHQRPRIAKRTYTVDSIASIDSCSYSKKVPPKSAPNLAVPAVPIPTVFFPGCALMPMFKGIRNGIPLSRRSQPFHKNDVPIAMSVGLMGNSTVEVKNETRIPLVRRLSRKFSGISRVEVPHSPFDPFGTVKEAPLERAVREEEAKLATVYGNSNENDVNAVGEETIVTEESLNTGNETDNEASPRDSQQGDLFSESEELGELPIEFQIGPNPYVNRNSSSAVHSSSRDNVAGFGVIVPNPASRSNSAYQKRPRSAMLLRSLHHSFVGSGHPLSVSAKEKVERMMYVGDDGVRPNTSSSPDLTSHQSICSGEDIVDDGSAEGHVAAESQTNASSQVLPIETGHSAASAENDSSIGTSASTLATQGFGQKDQKDQGKLHRRVSTRLRQAVMTRFHKFAHPKRN